MRRGKLYISYLAYFDHAGCALGIYARCTARINGRPGLLCQTVMEGDLRLEPLLGTTVVKELVAARETK